MGADDRHSRIPHLGGQRLTVGTGTVFITFEGGEGAGKSTQARLLADWLEESGLPVVRTREPGGTKGAEAIRELVLGGNSDAWGAGVEALLMTAARLDHVERLIAPALAGGQWVVCDRFLDSTRVYQGVAGGLGIERIDALHRLFMPSSRPDLTILLDLPVEHGLGRRGVAGGSTRFEAKGALFHESVRQGFLELARAEPERIRIMDAALPVDRLAAAIKALVRARFSAAMPSSAAG